MKYKLILVFISLFTITLSSFGQERTSNSSDAQDSTKVVVAHDSLRNEESSLINAMSTTVGVLNGKIRHYEQEIKRLRGDSIAKSDTIAQLREAIARRNAERQNAQEEATTAQKDKERIEHLLSNVDAIVYKQCLLYPLEARYDSVSVSEAIQAVDAVSRIMQNPSEKFTNYKNVYYGLLTQYGTFNSQLLSLLKRERRVLSMTNWVVGAHKEKFITDLHALPYWKYYVKKDQAPYQSILYLDQIIDKFRNIIKKTGNVKTDIDNLINDMSPKSK